MGTARVPDKVKRQQITSKQIATATGLVLLGAIASAAGMAVAVSRHATRNAGVIARGVTVGDVPVGGLTPDEAHDRVRTWAQRKMQGSVTLVAPVSHREWHITVADLGGRFFIDPAIQSAFQVGKDASFWDQAVESVRGQGRHVGIEPKFEFNQAMLDRRLKRIAVAVHRPAKNARAELSAGGNLAVTTPETTGIDLDLPATTAALLKNGPDGLLSGARTPLVVTETRPAVTSADLGRAGTLLSSFFTSYGSSSENRRHNVELAASHIDGTLLAPGEVFSYNDVVGPRTPETGWLNAPTYQDGQVVPGPGGGVCQVSTTLYNAVLRAGLKIVQRSHHSMPVHYVDAGRDATVAYGDIDFKFENDTNGPVLVAARATKGKLAFNLYGKPPVEVRKISLASSDKTPTASGGFTVTTYRIITGADGVPKREALSTDTYMPYIPASKASATAKPKRVPKTVKPAASPAAAPTPAAAPAEAQPTPAVPDSA